MSLCYSEVLNYLLNNKIGLTAEMCKIIENHSEDVYSIIFGNNIKAKKNATYLREFCRSSLSKDGILLFCGIKMQIEKRYKDMENFYLSSIKEGNIIAMFCLANYYIKTSQRHNKIKEYLSIVIDKGDIDAMYYFGDYYRGLKKYDKMKKYFLMAVEKGDSMSMHDLGYHFRMIEKDLEKAEKYFLIAAKKGFMSSMCALAHFYNEKKDYISMELYACMAADKGNLQIMINLGYHFQTVEPNYEKMKKYYTMAIEKEDAKGYEGIPYIRGCSKVISFMERYCEKNDIYRILMEMNNKSALVLNFLQNFATNAVEYNSNFA